MDGFGDKRILTPSIIGHLGTHRPASLLTLEWSKVRMGIELNYY